MPQKPPAIPAASAQSSDPVSARAVITIDGKEISAQTERKAIRVVVDTHRYLPGTFEITFVEDGGTAPGEKKVTEELKIGDTIEISTPAGSSRSVLIHGTVTSMEAICENLMTYVIVRGHDLSHVLQRSRRTRIFPNKTDSDIANDIAKQAGLKVDGGTVQHEELEYTHRHLAQVAQTDWDFLQDRARANGFEMRMVGDVFHFGPTDNGAQPPQTNASSPGVAQRPLLTFGDDLLTFLPRLSARETLPDQVEVRTWDEENATVVSATAAVDYVNPAFRRPGTPFKTIAGKKQKGKLFPLDTHLVVDRPVGAGSGSFKAAKVLAGGIAKQIGATTAEAEGLTFGNSHIMPGRYVQIEGVPGPFCGNWIVTNVRHTFCEDEGGFFTRFFVTGRDTGSGSVSRRRDSDAGRRARGMMYGIVAEVAASPSVNRVKVSLPLLSKDYKTDWARVVQLGGNRGAVLFMPEVGDEVLVAFEWDDVNRPIVIGGMMRSGAGTMLGVDKAPGGGAKGKTHDSASGSPPELGKKEDEHKPGEVIHRGMVSSSGSRLAFREVPAGSARPDDESSIVLATALNDLGLTINETTGQVQLVCKPTTGKAKNRGTLTISTNGDGTVNIDAGPQGTVNVTGGDITLQASKKLALQSNGDLEIKGTRVKVTGTTIDLN
ncbi:VgrG-related protein [Streptomyces sp. NBC_00096]|uniref:VgrG-related protein n=1 Tax=Streptomyces sp. NBC_00096 TaxID=2975650 RepID=UPI00324E8B7D